MNKNFYLYSLLNGILWAVTIVISAILLKQDFYKVLLLFLVCGVISSFSVGRKHKIMVSLIVIWIGVIIAAIVLFGKGFFKFLIPPIICTGVSLPIFLKAERWSNYIVGNAVLWGGAIIGSAILLKGMFSKISLILIICAALSVVMLPFVCRKSD